MTELKELALHLFNQLVLISNLLFAYAGFWGLTL